MKFSANLGFLWTELPLPEAIRAAAAAGFDAVECHAPFGTPSAEVKAALDDTGLPMVSLNTARGAEGEMGLAALPGRQSAATEAITEAVAYARAVGAGGVHVLAGAARGDLARATFLRNLSFATRHAPDLTILIEPLNRHDAPGYFLGTTDQAREIIETVGAPNLRLMFDCYHVGRTEGDVITRLADLLPLIGHIQCASVPDRGPPDRGELHYPTIFASLKAMGWDRPVGAEYRPGGESANSLGWLHRV